MSVSYYSSTFAGPRKINEDAVSCWVAATGQTVACVADGLGGMGDGEVASTIAIAAFAAFLQDKGVSSETLISGAWSAHYKILEAQSRSPRASKMATTFTAVAVDNEKLLGVHCGDTRASIVRRSGIKRLTKDHSEGQRLFDAGKLTKAELRGYQRQHILESALGDQYEPQIEGFHFRIEPGDRILLTSDGVHNVVFLRELQKIASDSNGPKEICDAVAALVQERGATDNFSIVALQIA